MRYLIETIDLLLIYFIKFEYKFIYYDNDETLVYKGKSSFYKNPTC